MAKAKIPSHDAAVKAAVLEHIASDQYNGLGPTPSLPDSTWEDLEMDDEEWQSFNPKKAHPREVYAAAGKAELEHDIFLLVVNDLANKPVGFASTIETVLRSPEVLRAAFRMLDGAAGLVKKGASVEGIYAFVGAVWVDVFDEEKDQMLAWLRPIFLPLVKKGGAAYVSHFDAHGPKKTSVSSAVGIRAILQFLKDIRRMQILARSPPKSAYDYSPKSPDAISSFDLLTGDLSPLNHPDPTRKTAHISRPAARSRTAGTDELAQFFVWNEVSSPSGIEEELGMPYHHPLSSISNRDLETTRALCALSVDQPGPRGGGPLLPAIQLSGIKPTDGRAADRAANENFSVSSRKTPLSNVGSPSQITKSPREVGNDRAQRALDSKEFI
ncbi:hypothetical protein B0H17DRAFT_1328384 [Mycena rosella]|uniref:Uncharacterized protein n=1 Tax=Mycena rosella TaxID=1033263 RepID=A0AAD7DVQ7_MYCRO|nr:hypothetical protein B0H17DRAFT_1328384 [Mycena rosella]